MRVAADDVIDKIERRVVEARQRPRDRRRSEQARYAETTLPPEPTAELDESDDDSRVVKVKRFAIEPMFEEDAIARMEELGHSFFIFVNAESERIDALLPYAVVFPYRRMGQSITAFRPDRTGGKFGPFQDQLFVGDYSLSIVMRATTEEVDGVWQGACYPFREGLGNGILAIEFSDRGYLITGGTNRGWPVRGNKSFVLERLEWTGVTPFDVLEIRAAKDGFDVSFTAPCEPATLADVTNYRLRSFTHHYQKFYGSPEVDETTPVVTEAAPSSDGRSVHLVVDGLVEGHVHDFIFGALQSADGEPLVHTTAHYTLNRIPK